MAYIKIYSGSVVNVQYVKQSLEVKGIHAIVKDSSSSAFSAGFGALSPDFQELFVHSDEVSKVKNIIGNL